jgi:hypothetical protein
MHAQMHVPDALADRPLVLASNHASTFCGDSSSCPMSRAS